MLSLNDGSTFEKHYKDVYPTELELRKENNSNSCASLLDLYIYIEDGEFHTRLFDKRDNFGFDIVRMPIYCSNVPSKMFYGSIEAEFLRISRATSKIEHLSRNCKQLLNRMLKQNGQMRRIKFSLIKMIQRHQEGSNASHRFLNTHENIKISDIFLHKFLHLSHIFTIFVFCILFYNFK